MVFDVNISLFGKKICVIKKLCVTLQSLLKESSLAHSSIG